MEQKPVDYSNLVSAISDVGYWRWWSDSLPDLFQLEFGGVQIYEPPTDKTKPPSGLLALRFFRPSCVSFIRREIGADTLPLDWPRLLNADKIDPFAISNEQFALNDDVLGQAILGQAKDETVHFTDASGGNDVKLAFWAGIAGMRIEAAEVRPVLLRGEVALSTIASLNRDWWAYWQDYWKKRETTDAMPKDFACEVTFPIKRE